MTKKSLRKNKLGLSPGSLVYTGSQTHKIDVGVIQYNEKTFLEKKSLDLKEALALEQKDHITWVNVSGVHDSQTIAALGEEKNVHPLVLEDIMSVHQRPKTDFFDDYIYLVVQMIHYDEQTKRVSSEQVSFIITSSLVISLQETPEDVFDHVRKRIRESKGRIRKSSTDYLAFALLDVIVDHYFVILEKVGEEIEEYEALVMISPEQENLKEIYRLKREMITLRKAVWPLREAITRFERSEHKIIQKETIPFFRDLYDHTIQVIDTIETQRDMISGLLDLYLSSVSNRMNEVMKVLTIIATIFIPLTFIAGVYGMNFENMPELSWPGAYFATLGVMAFIGLMMVWFFQRKKWL